MNNKEDNVLLGLDFFYLRRRCSGYIKDSIIFEEKVLVIYRMFLFKVFGEYFLYGEILFNNKFFLFGIIFVMFFL